MEYETRKIESQIFTRLMALFPNVHTESSNNEEIEERANQYFQELYKGEKQVEDLVLIMKEFRSSQNSTEREIYACMVQNLFDEWKFFPKYPKKELSMTARLFGKIISEKKIIDGVVTDIGLKCIVEGLKREGKMFDFAITALEECKGSIEHDAGLKNILASKQLKEKKPDLFEFIFNRYSKNVEGKSQIPPGTSNINFIISLEQPEEPINMPNMRGPGMVLPPREEQPQILMPPQVPPQYASPNLIRNTHTPGREMLQNPMMVVGPPMNDPRMMEGNFHPGFGAKKQTVQNPLVNTPTPPGKYFDQQNPGSWRNVPQPMRPKGIYSQTPTLQQPQRSARPFEQISLGTPALDNSSASTPKALNLRSKDFKPKTQQVQEYLKREEMSLPIEFMEMLTTTLNMTGSEQIITNAIKLERSIEKEYIPQIAHHIVVKRVIESDEKRIEFFATFFSCMRSKNVIKALIEECVDVIIRIMVNE